jgi:hypothetical protein
MDVFGNILFPVKDFAQSKVATAPDPASTGTSLSVIEDEGALFPDTDTEGVFRAYVWPDATDPDATNCEEIEVSVRSTDDFTIVRSKNSIVRSILVGDNIAINYGKSKEDQILGALRDGRVEDVLLPSESFTRVSDYSFKSPRDKTDYYTNGRVVLVNDSDVITAHRVVSSSYSAPDTTIILEELNALPTDLDNVYIAIQPKDATNVTLGTIANIEGEIPTGDIDGSNDEFELAHEPALGSVRVYLNGVRQKLTDDYTFSGSTITFVSAPLTDSKILVDYSLSLGSYAGGGVFMVINETPTGTVDGSNDEFEIEREPVVDTLEVYRDGQEIYETDDWTLSGTTLTFVTPPEVDSTLRVKYQYANSSSGNADMLDEKHASDFTQNADTDVSGNSYVLDEDDMASDDDTKVSTQQSTKAFVTSGTIIMTNKRLTSPKINEDVALTATATEINKLDGFNGDKCQATNSGSQSIPSSTDTILDLGAEDYDTNTMHDNVTNNSRITIKTAGYYQIGSYIVFAANATGIRSFQIKKNGNAARINTQNAPSGGDCQTMGSCVLQLNVNDYIQLQVYQNSGGTLNATSAILTVTQLI